MPSLCLRNGILQAQCPHASGKHRPPACPGGRKRIAGCGVPGRHRAENRVSRFHDTSGDARTSQPVKRLAVCLALTRVGLRPCLGNPYTTRAAAFRLKSLLVEGLSIGTYKPGTERARMPPRTSSTLPEATRPVKVYSTSRTTANRYGGPGIRVKQPDDPESACRRQERRAFNPRSGPAAPPAKKLIHIAHITHVKHTDLDWTIRLTCRDNLSGATVTSVKDSQPPTLKYVFSLIDTASCLALLL